MAQLPTEAVPVAPRFNDIEFVRAYKRAWGKSNRDKIAKYARDYRAKNPHKVRSFNLKKSHGITLDQFNAMLLAQESRCAICRTDSSAGRNWHVDHSHQTGKIRGILCHSCNLMIGQAKDNIKTLLAAVEYLK